MIQKNCHLRTIAQLCRAMSPQLRHVSTIGKNLLSSNISPTCSYNMVNFGPLAAEIVSLVWGTPGNFKGFRVLSALLHSQTVATNRGRHLYSAGRPSSGALATFLVIFCYTISAMTLLVGQQEEGRPTHKDLLQSFLFGRPGPTWSNSRKKRQSNRN